MKKLKKAVQDYLDFEVSDPSITVEIALRQNSSSLKKKWNKMLKSGDKIKFYHYWIDGYFCLYSDND